MSDPSALELYADDVLKNGTYAITYKDSNGQPFRQLVTLMTSVSGSPLAMQDWLQDSHHKWTVELWGGPGKHTWTFTRQNPWWIIAVVNFKVAGLEDRDGHQSWKVVRSSQDAYTVQWTCAPQLFLTAPSAVSQDRQLTVEEKKDGYERQEWVFTKL